MPASSPSQASSPIRCCGWRSWCSSAVMLRGAPSARWWCRVADGGGLRELAPIYRRLIGARIRTDWQYRLSFVLYTAAQFFVTILDFLTIAVIFHNVPRLAGWSISEVAFLYGTSGLAFGLSDVFVSPVERCALYVKQGTFDQFLIRPLGPLFQLACREF